MHALMLALTLATAEVPPSPPAEHPPAVVQALRSPVDLYGIPRDLYPLDAQLFGLRRAVDDRVRSQRSTGTGLVAAGVIGFAVAGVLTAVAANNAAKAREPGTIVIHDPSTMQYTFAAIGAVTSSISLGYGIKMLLSKPDPEYLQRYYWSTYSR